MQTASFLQNALVIGGLAASSCFGSTVYLASSASETTNNSNQATVNISPNSAWSAPFSNTQWVSNVQSGDPNGAGYVQVPNGTDVAFTDTFQVSGTPNFGELLVLADDTTSVTLNGIVLTNFAPTAGNTYATCSDFAIGCTTASEGVIYLTNALKSGTNVLTFNVEQIAGWSFGLDYSGVVTSVQPADVTTSATPEPGTLALFGLPLLLVGVLKKKMKA